MGRPACIVLFGVGLLVGACNVFGVSDPEPNTVDALLADARSALTVGNTSRAVRLLERAFEKDSTDVRVRIELGNALFLDRGLDVFTLRAAAEHLVGPSGSAGTSTLTPSPREGAVCTDGAQPEEAADRYSSVPLDAEPLRRLAEHASVVERVRRLVVEGVLERRSTALSKTDVRVRRKGLLVAAVTIVTRMVIDVHDIFETTESRLFLDRGAQSPRALVACAGSERALTEDHEALCALSNATDQAVQWLQDRNRLSGSDQGAILVERLQTIADAITARIDCSESASSRRLLVEQGRDRRGARGSNGLRLASCSTLQ